MTSSMSLLSLLSPVQRSQAVTIGQTVHTDSVAGCPFYSQLGHISSTAHPTLPALAARALH